MKRIVRNGMAITALTLMLGITSCNDSKNQEKETSNTVENKAPQDEMVVEAKTKEKAVAKFSNDITAKGYQDYLEIKDAMVASDPEAAKEAAKDLQKLYAEDDSYNISNLAGHIATTDGIERQRELFSELTAAMEPALKESISSGEIYKQFCPMAFEGKGDYWYSNTEEIRNPYFGDKMLKCGRLEETIQ